MANSTSANLRLTVQATGENSGTWGQITNTNLLILEQAIGGFTTFNLTNANRSLTFTNGALSNGWCVGCVWCLLQLLNFQLQKHQVLDLHYLKLLELHLKY